MSNILQVKGNYFAWVLVALLSACATVPTETVAVYSSKARSHLYELAHWTFEGRLAIVGQKDSWSANITWEHSPIEEKLKLAGPLGQGAVIIQLRDNSVSIDRGDGSVRRSDHPIEFLNQELGMLVPLLSLRYWAVGLPEPSGDFYEIGNGFRQDGWLTEYSQMQLVEGQLMPRKIAVVGDEVKLKLFIDHWDLTDVKTK